MKASRLGGILVELGKLSEEKLAEALSQQNGTGRFLGDLLVDLGYVSDADIAQALAQQLDIPYVDLDEDFKLGQEEVRLIPETIARRFCLIPVRQNGGQSVTLVMRDPLDIEAVDAVRSLTNLDVHRAVGTEARIRAIIDRFYREDAHIERNLADIALLEDEDRDATDGSAQDADKLRVLANDAPVVRFVNLVLMQSVRDGASDIHFEPGENDVTVRLRVDGVLREVTPPPKSLYAAVVTRLKILSDMDIAERRLPLDGRFRFTAAGRVIDVRVSSLPEVHGEKMVLRILDRDALIVDLESIGFNSELTRRFQEILHMPNGIILLSGPTGSGKTTTLYSALTYLRSPTKNIQTVEDPVEYQMEGINQMPVRAKIGLTFANALRSILRQDPDIILIGEIRDLETAEIAMRASLTGHLVLSTLHTNDSPAAFWRLQDIGVEPYLIAATVKLVLSQRLVRQICKHCTQDTRPSDEHVRVVSKVFPDAPAWTYASGAGCRECGDSGYKGRTAIFEFMEVTNVLRESFLGGETEVVFKQKAQTEGMDPLLYSGLQKVKQGLTTVDEVLAACPLV